MARLSARRKGSRAEVRIEDLSLCRDDLLVSRGVEVTKERTMSGKAETGEWILFGGFAGLAALGSIALQDMECPNGGCIDMAFVYLGTIGSAAGAVVSGSVLLVDQLRAIDTSESFETSRSSERVVRVCRSDPRQGAVVQVAYGGTRAESMTNQDGIAELALGLSAGPLAEVSVQLWLDGAPLGSVPLTAEWKHATILQRTR